MNALELYYNFLTSSPVFPDENPAHLEKYKNVLLYIKEILHSLGNDLQNNSDHRLIRTYNITVHGLNQRIPQEPLPFVWMPLINKINKLREIFPPLQSSYSPSSPTDDEILEYANFINRGDAIALAYIVLEERVRLLESKGARVKILPKYLKHDYRNSHIKIPLDSQVFTVCHAGLWRSRTLRLAVELMSQSNKLSNVKVHEAHGTIAGFHEGELYNTYTDPTLMYFDAFGFPSPFRFGEVYVRSNPTADANAYFHANFYQHDGKTRKIYMVFDAAISRVSHHLLKNLDLKNVDIYLIPMEDLISPYTPSISLVKDIISKMADIKVPVNATFAPSNPVDGSWLDGEQIPSGCLNDFIKAMAELRSIVPFTVADIVYTLKILNFRYALKQMMSLLEVDTQKG